MPWGHSRNRLTTPCAGLLWLSLVCVCSAGNVRPGDGDYPRPNPQPEKFLLLHGSIDEALDINFRVEWYANNPKCRYATSFLEGAYAGYTAWTPLAVARQGATFSGHVPVDGVVPGRCDWRFGGVTFGGATGFRTSLIATSSYPLKPGQSPNGVAELHCKWISINSPGFTNPNLQCHSSKNEDCNASVLGGKLWWHPAATDMEVHILAEQ